MQKYQNILKVVRGLEKEFDVAFYVPVGQRGKLFKVNGLLGAKTKKAALAAIYATALEMSKMKVEDFEKNFVGKKRVKGFSLKGRNGKVRIALPFIRGKTRIDNEKVEKVTNSKGLKRVPEYDSIRDAYNTQIDGVESDYEYLGEEVEKALRKPNLGKKVKKALEEKKRYIEDVLRQIEDLLENRAIDKAITKIERREVRLERARSRNREMAKSMLLEGEKEMLSIFQDFRKWRAEMKYIQDVLSKA